MTKTKTLEKHFKRFDYVNSDIKNGLFPLLEVSDKVEYKVFHFDRYISSEEAVAKIRTEGFDPATFSELLAWPLPRLVGPWLECRLPFPRCSQFVL